MLSDHVTPGLDNGWDFYSDPAAVSGYVAHRAEGLSRNSLIEEPAFLSLVGDVQARDCLDLGCGYGYYSEIMAQLGARVTGVDKAPLMIAEARRRDRHASTYRVGDAETVEFPGDSFDVVISNLTFHYIDDIGSLLKRILGWLRPGGLLVFTVEHPVFTAPIDQEAWADEGGDRRRWIVSDYFSEGERWGRFGRKYHHTFEAWVNATLLAGFTLTAVSEPRPSPQALELVPTLSEDQHRPLYLIMAGRKPTSR